ncbi:MAG TPA: hypothetical protein VGT60_02105, partial [Candidatus Limnocylindria bacterium]|nr:hypothetical protein [Candidatus Limnocylindria bacterium]
GPLHDVYQAARTLEDELTGLLATAEGKPAPPPRSLVPTETPPVATTAQSALTTTPAVLSTPASVVATVAPYVPTAAPFVPTAPPVALPIVSVTRVAYGPCTTPAPGGLIKGWINCPGTVYLQINRPLPSGDLRVGFDWPSLGSFFYGTAHVGSTTGPVDVHVVNTFINACVTTYLSTVQVYDGAVSGPLVARQQLTLTTTCQ